jgi:hypothetical protein
MKKLEILSFFSRRVNKKPFLLKVFLSSIPFDCIVSFTLMMASDLK